MNAVTIGDAKLYLGDCRELLAALAPFDAVVTDPPYGIGYHHGGGGVWGNSNLTGTAAPATCCDPIAGDDGGFPYHLILAAAPKVLVWGADHFRSQLPAGGSFLVWDKSLGVGPADSFADAEFAWTSVAGVKRAVYRHLWKGLLREGEDRKAADRRRFHVSQKPQELMRWCLQILRLRPGSIVVDPCMGSGTTALACQTLGLRFVGIEIDPAHFATAVHRVEAAQAIAAGS